MYSCQQSSAAKTSLSLAKYFANHAIFYLYMYLFILYPNIFVFPSVFCLKTVSAYMFIPGGKYKTQFNRYTTETVYENGGF